MRLIGYGPGEMLDRLTILDLKLRYGTGDLDHFKAEQRQLVAQIEPTYFVAGLPLILILELASINGAIWHGIDALKALLDAETPTREIGPGSALEAAGRLGIRLYLWNEARAKVIEAINTRVGHEGGKEKLG